MSFNPTKCKVQLKLAVGRLKLLQAKKASLNKQAARELAELLAKKKEESARIRVEHVIREDLNSEAMEILELYCELLLARFGLLEQMKQCDQAISEAVNTVIYAAPRSEVKELQLVRDQLILKFGRDFAVAAMENRHNLVNPRVISKLKVETPELSLVEKYLETIAAEYKVDWKPANCDDVDDCENSEDDQALLDLPEDGEKPSRLSAGQATPAPVGFCTSCGSHEPAIVGKVPQSTQTAKAESVSSTSTVSGTAKYPTPKLPQPGSGYQADSPKQPFHDHLRSQYQQNASDHQKSQHPPQQQPGPQFPQAPTSSLVPPAFPQPPAVHPGVAAPSTLQLLSSANEPAEGAAPAAAGVSGWKPVEDPQVAGEQGFAPTAPVDEQVPPYSEDMCAGYSLPPEKPKDGAPESRNQPSTGDEEYDDLARRFEALKRRK